MANDDPIEVRIGGKTIKNAISADDGPALERVSRALIVVSRLARTARDRSRRGQYVGSPRPYSHKRPYIVSKSYAAAVGNKRQGWRSSAVFHGAVKGVPGVITGGMLGGLRVRNYGIKGAVVEFAGRSLGSMTRKRKRGGANQRVMVANRKKASQVWRRLRVNLIQPTDTEIIAMGSATTLVLAADIGRAMSATKTQVADTTGSILTTRQIMGDLRRGTPPRL